MVLVDTSSWIESLRKTGDPLIRQRVEALLLNGEAAWCEMVRLELWNGARGDREKAALRQFDRDLPRLEMSAGVWELGCDLARQCRAKGVTLPATDLLIAACARFHGVAIEQSDADFAEIDRVAP